mmetsp:Transcript_26739/g.39550  ORF Transcript_26739/g.39550 Transcript_26739/m.39550 type:complete len:143 (-) Transcript_26739:233-661(-)
MRRINPNMTHNMPPESSIQVFSRNKHDKPTSTIPTIMNQTEIKINKAFVVKPGHATETMPILKLSKNVTPYVKDRAVIPAPRLQTNHNFKRDTRLSMMQKTPNKMAKLFKVVSGKAMKQIPTVSKMIALPKTIGQYEAIISK